MLGGSDSRKEFCLSRTAGPCHLRSACAPPAISLGTPDKRSLLYTCTIGSLLPHRQQERQRLLLTLLKGDDEEEERPKSGFLTMVEAFAIMEFGGGRG